MMTQRIKYLSLHPFAHFLLYRRCAGQDLDDPVNLGDVVHPWFREASAEFRRCQEVGIGAGPGYWAKSVILYGGMSAETRNGTDTHCSPDAFICC